MCLRTSRERFEALLPYFRTILIVRKWERGTDPVRVEKRTRGLSPSVLSPRKTEGSDVPTHIA